MKMFRRTLKELKLGYLIAVVCTTATVKSTTTLFPIKHNVICTAFLKW